MQESKLCGVHCINTVLQGPFFSEVDLAAMAADLDRRELQMVMDSGVASQELMGGSSSNVALDGNFSIQVLAKALDIWDLKLISLEAHDAQQAKVNPQQEDAFICHLQDHWFTIRKVGGEWYNFNSLYPAPEHLSNFYLSAYLGSLQSAGWSIFVVRGNFSTDCGVASDPGSGFGRWLTPEDAERIIRSKTTGRTSTEEDPMLLAAIKASLQDEPRSSRMSTSQDVSALAAAMAATLANIQVPGTQEPTNESHDGSGRGL